MTFALCKKAQEIDRILYSVVLLGPQRRISHPRSRGDAHTVKIKLSLTKKCLQCDMIKFCYDILSVSHMACASVILAMWAKKTVRRPLRVCQDYRKRTWDQWFAHRFRGIKIGICALVQVLGMIWSEQKSAT